MADYDRIEEVLKYLNLNANQLSKALELSSSQTFYDIKRGKCGISKRLAKKIEDKFFINSNWLRTGGGDMLKNRDARLVKTTLDSIPVPKDKVVPLYDYSNISEVIKGRELDPNEYIYIPNLTSCDGAVYMRGDSMSPFINPGDVVLYKRVKNIVSFGEIYLILTYQDNESYVLMKYIRQSDKEGYVKLANYASESRPYDFSVNDIHGLALVKASIKYISML